MDIEWFVTTSLQAVSHLPPDINPGTLDKVAIFSCIIVDLYKDNS